MPVVEALGAVLGGAEHAALLAVPGDAVALEVGDVSRQRRRVEGAPLMPNHPGLDDDTTVGGEQTAAAEVARPTDKISCFPPHLDCIRTCLRSRGSLDCRARLYAAWRAAPFVRYDCYAATPISFGVAVVLPLACAFGSLNRNSLPSRHIACMITASLRATATQARL
jgi:hypothetical protein